LSNSIRLPKETRRIFSRTPGKTRDSITFTL